MNLRPFADADLDALYAISLATGLAGGDASALYRDGRMIGHIYSAPYARLHPELAFVAEDALGVAGFVLGVSDTRAFENRLELEWWPDLRRLYPDPGVTPKPDWDADRRRSFMIHHPRRAPEPVVREYPAHLHMNLLPRRQGQGLGRALLALWLRAAGEMGVRSVHVAPNPQNLRGIGFWQACGFEPIGDGASSGAWLGLHLPSAGRHGGAGPGSVSV